jgi:hypothetical protein
MVAAPGNKRISGLKKVCLCRVELPAQCGSTMWCKVATKRLGGEYRRGKD